MLTGLQGADGLTPIKPENAVSGGFVRRQAYVPLSTDGDYLWARHPGHSTPVGALESCPPPMRNALVFYHIKY